MFKEFGVMLDCSRNAVINVESLEKFIDLLAAMGYNSLQLYTEDTYEVQNEPYFGYLRSRYTAQELKEIDAYAASKGVELVPCIQTLAHLNSIFNCGAYREILDIDDVLLVDEPRTYRLIENMFATLAECFSSRKVMIGMDEAPHLGLGKYLHKHGVQNRYDIFLKHLNKVLEIAKKYGFEARMWSDMFFRLANQGNYHITEGAALTEEMEKISKDIPDVELVYWDYYHQEKADYANMLDAHAKLHDKNSFAGAAWTWIGYIPSNLYTLKTMLPAVEACQEKKVNGFVMTMWGDDGGECSFFSALPSLFYVAEYARGNRDEKSIKEKFEKTVGLSYDALMAIENLNHWGEDRTTENPTKYLLFNDCFAGCLDCTLRGDEAEQFAKYTEALQPYRNHKEYGYLFESAYRLGDALTIKCDIGQRTRKAYAEKDKEGLQTLVAEYGVLAEKIQAFHEAFSKLWYKENKAFGFEIQDYRIGGLKQRVLSCKNRLQAYIDGKTDCIEELETQLLNEWEGGTEFTKQPKTHCLFHAAISYSKL